MIYPQLPTHDMDKRHHGLTKATAASLIEAAQVCLSRHHRSPTDFLIRNSAEETKTTVKWPLPDDRTRNAWANTRETTESGACACVLAAVELCEGLVAVMRAENGSGVDYYLAQPGSEPEDLESCARLEVSGVDAGNAANLAGRLRQKLRQAAEGDSNLPAIAGVIGFHLKTVLLAPLEES